MASSLGSRPSIGGSIDDYVIVARLGEGSSSVVYRVREASSGREFALKLMVAMGNDSRQELLRFHREIELASSLSHPNLVRVLTSSVYQGLPYSVMELVQGPSLREVLHQRPPGRSTHAWRKTVFELGTPLFGALQYLHNQRIIHGDVKPDNVFVADARRPVLGDYGMSRAHNRESQDTAGTIRGTIAYMGPELLAGRDADRRSDLFALGVLLLELISGQLPYPERDLPSIVNTLISERPLRLRELEPDAGEALEAVLARMTAPSPHERYFTVADAYYDWLDAARVWCDADSVDLPLVEATVYDVVLPALAGREDDLAFLDRTRARVNVDQGTAVWVVGPTGVGRTRLVEHWARRVPDTVLQFHGRGVAQQSWPYGTLTGLLREMLAHLSDEEKGELRILPRVVSEQPLMSESTALEPLSDAETGILHEEIRRNLGALAAPHGLVLVLDDFHHADLETQEVVRALLEHRRGVPNAMLVLVAEDTGGFSWLDTVRTEEAANLSPRGALPRSIRLALRPLDAAAVWRVAQSALGVREGESLPPRVEEALAVDGGGLPRSVTETLNAFLREGVLQRVRGAWQWSEAEYMRFQAENAADRLPSLKRLAFKLLASPGPERSVLCAGIVSRGGFRFQEVVAASGVGERICIDTLDRLQDAGLLVADKGVYSFRDQLLWRHLLEEISSPERDELHQRWVAVLASMVAEPSGMGRDTARRMGRGTVGDTVQRLLDLCDTRVDWSGVVSSLESAADQVEKVQGYALAFRIYEKLLEKGRRDKDDDRLDQLVLRMARSGVMAGHFDTVLGLVQERLGRGTGARRPALQRLLASTWEDQGDYAAALRGWLDAFSSLGVDVPAAGWWGALRTLAGLGRSVLPWTDRRLLEPSDRIEPLLEVCDGIMHAHHFVADPSAGNAVLCAVSLSIRIARATRRKDRLATTHLLLAYFYAMWPRLPWRRVQYHAERGLQYVREHGQPEVAIVMLRDIAYAFVQLGQPSRAQQLTSDGFQQARALADPVGQASNLLLRAQARRWTGELDEAERDLGKVRVLVDRLHHRRLGVSLRLQLISVYVWRGRFDVARDLLEEPTGYFEVTAYDQLAAGVYGACLRLRQGRWEEAQTQAWQACDLARRRRGGRLWLLQALQVGGLALGEESRRTGWTLSRRQTLHRLVRESRSQGADLPMFEVLRAPLEAELAEVHGHVDKATAILNRGFSLGHQHGFLTDAAWCLQRQALLRRRHWLLDWRDVLERAARAWEACHAPMQAARLRGLADGGDLPADL